MVFASGTTICPCGSRKPSLDCCERIPGFFFVKPKVIPYRKEGYSHPRCYMGFTNDCSAKISREHLMSDSIMKLLGTTSDRHIVNRRGDKIRDVAPAVVAKVLCDRHNSIFGSYFDPVGLRIAKAIYRFNTDKEFSCDIMISGYDFERFLLQRMCNHYYAGQMFVAGEVITAPLSELLLKDAFLHERFLDNAGMYLVDSPSYSNSSERYEIAPLIERVVGEEGIKSLVGMRWIICGISFAILIKPADHLPTELKAIRPQGITLCDKKGARVRIRFTWRADYPTCPEIDLYVVPSGSIPYTPPSFFDINDDTGPYCSPFD